MVALRRKVGLLLAMVVLSPVALALQLFQRWVAVPLAPLFSERIGHFAAKTEIYLCEREAGIDVPRARSFDVLYYRSPASNSQLKKMWDRTLRIYPFALAYSLDRLSHFLARSEIHDIRMSEARDVHGLLARTQPHLSFTPEEERAGWAAVRAMGIPERTRFVCFHARGPEYLRTIYPHFDSSYHDYRDSNIKNYLPAVELLTRWGYYAVRMGSIVKEALLTTHPKIIDYARNGCRSDFLDIFLGARCHFFMSSGTGIDAIPMIFRRPFMYVNYVPLEYATTWLPDHLFIPKKHWLRAEGRFLTFREILDSGVGRFLRSEQYTARGIEVIENTPEEIAALAIEMDERVTGTWRTTEEDEELQRRFWSLYPPTNCTA
jgi:putative glycosyltransferase (TIGR04372 family)